MNTTVCGSPYEASRRPCASATAMKPACSDSTMPPRVSSTRGSGPMLDRAGEHVVHVLQAGAQAARVVLAQRHGHAEAVEQVFGHGGGGGTALAGAHHGLHLAPHEPEKIGGRL